MGGTTGGTTAGGTTTPGASGVKYHYADAPLYFHDADDIAKWGIDRGVTSAEKVDDYVHIVPSDGNPVYSPINSMTGSRYVAIKYRTDKAAGTKLEFFLGSSGTLAVGGANLTTDIIADGEWHLVVMDTLALTETDMYNGELAAFFRLDPIETGEENGSRKPLPEGAYIDIEYIGFFHTEDAAKEFDTNRNAE